MTLGLKAGDQSFIISVDTLRTDHLFPKFLRALHRLAGQEAVDKFMEDTPWVQGYEGWTEDDERWKAEEMGYAMEELQDRIGDACPEEHWFGSSEGDGACFGVWYQPEKPEEGEPYWTDENKYMVDEDVELGEVRHSPDGSGKDWKASVWLLDGDDEKFRRTERYETESAAKDWVEATAVEW